MKKTPSLFKRDYEGTRLAYNEVVEGSEWVIKGEGIATLKIDGTACMVQKGKLYKRYDRKLTKSAYKRKKRSNFVPSVDNFKPAPDGWRPCEKHPNKYTGHWPGWLPVGDEPDSKYHREAFAYERLLDGTYELVGPSVQGNLYNLKKHRLWKHGDKVLEDVPRNFEGLKEWFKDRLIEGVVWHHHDGRMVKIKRRDFGYDWPIKN